MARLGELGLEDWIIEGRYGIIRGLPSSLLILLWDGRHRQLGITAHLIATTRFVTRGGSTDAR